MIEVTLIFGQSVFVIDGYVRLGLYVVCACQVLPPLNLAKRSLLSTI